jgi:hypothetical protein
MSGPLLLFGSFARPQESAAYRGLLGCAMKTQLSNLSGGSNFFHISVEGVTHRGGTSAANVPHPKIIADIIVG